MPSRDTPYLHAKVPWVPLVGLWGTISYSPLLVRRQFGSEQTIPLTSGLNKLDFQHDNSEQYKEAIE